MAQDCCVQCFLLCVCVSVIWSWTCTSFGGEFSHISSLLEARSSLWDHWGGQCSSFCNLISWQLSFLRLRLLVIRLLPLSGSTSYEPQLILLYLSFSNLSVRAWTAHIAPTWFISSPAAPSPSHPLLCHPSLHAVWKLPVSFLCSYHGRAILLKLLNLFIISGLCFWCLIKRLRYANSQLIPLISVCFGNLGARSLQNVQPSYLLSVLLESSLEVC